MKRILVILLAASLFAGSAFAADNVFSALVPKNAKTMGMGGVFSAIPTAEFSFFGNPAAFAAKKASYTFVSADVWAYVKPTSANLATIMNISTLIDDNDYSSIYDLIPSNGGIGAGTSMSVSAFAGKGFGLGVFFTTDEWAQGKTLPSVLDTETELSAIIGLGVPITLGNLRLSVGGDLRPFYRIHGSDLDISSLVSTMMNGGDTEAALDKIKYLYSGFGLAMDLGATLELGSFGLGVAIRDISPAYPVFKGTVAELYDALVAGNLPETSTNADGDSITAAFVPDVSMGLSWKPSFIPGLIEPSFYCELQDFVSVAKNWDGMGSVLNLLHAGTEVKLLSILYARGGINRGYFSLGGGVKLLFIDVNASVFTEELGTLAGDQPRSGVAVQAAIRF
jgi:hypothetical protein